MKQIRFQIQSLVFQSSIWASFLLLTSCSYESDQIALAYQPTLVESPILTAEQINVDLKVRDVRRIKTCVGRKIGSHGEEAAYIKLEKNFKEEITEAVTLELEKRGFQLKAGGTQIQIEIERFFNDFKPGTWFATSHAELILNATVIRKDGVVAYTSTVTGEGDHENIWTFSGQNAKVPLEAAFNSAIHKLLNDPHFLKALLSRDYVQAKED